MNARSKFAVLVQQRRRWLLLGMLALLHLTVIEGVPSTIAATLMVGHIGLFFLWQPFVRAERHLALRHFLAIGLTLGALVLWLDWWLLTVWVVLFAGIIGGKVFVFEGRATRLFYLLALGYLLAALLVLLVPKVLPHGLAAGDTFGSLARWGLPAIFLVMALLPRDEETGDHAEVVDFAYSIFVILTLAVLVLGTIATMQLRGSGYIEALLQVTLIFGVALLFLAWTWDPRLGFSGIGAIFSRYMLTIGMPFEQWVHSLSEYAQRDDDPEEFLRWACEELLRRIPWVRGGHWQTPAGEGDFGLRGGGRREFHQELLTVALYTRQPLSPALAWHLHVVTRLLAEFYRARLRARKLRQLSYLQAVYETGARLTHDVKNLLQALNALCFAAAGEGDDSSPQFQALLRRQLPAIARRLQQTLEKLNAPVAEDADRLVALRWWEDLRRRYAAQAVAFETAGEVAAATVPAGLFNSAAENFLQNAIEKRAAGGGLRIVARLEATERGPVLSVSDDGAPVPGRVLAELGSGPVISAAGLGIGLYQVSRYAELMQYRLRLAANRPGEVTFALEPEPAA